MNNKFISGFYGTLSIAIWGFTMLLIAFMIVLLCTAQNKKPVIELNSITVNAADGYDTVLSEKIADTNGWYKAEYKIKITGAKLSPFSYTAEKAIYKNNSGATDCFLACDDEIEYSKLSPCEVSLCLYIKSNSAQAAAEIAKNASFGLRGVKQNFAFFYKELVINLPGFSASDFDVEPEIA